MLRDLYLMYVPTSILMKCFKTQVQDFLVDQEKAFLFKYPSEFDGMEHGAPFPPIDIRLDCYGAEGGVSINAPRARSRRTPAIASCLPSFTPARTVPTSP